MSRFFSDRPKHFFVYAFAAIATSTGITGCMVSEPMIDAKATADRMNAYARAHQSMSDQQNQEYVQRQIREGKVVDARRRPLTAQRNSNSDSGAGRSQNLTTDTPEACDKQAFRMMLQLSSKEHIQGVSREQAVRLVNNGIVCKRESVARAHDSLKWAELAKKTAFISSGDEKERTLSVADNIEDKIYQHAIMMPVPERKEKIVKDYARKQCQDEIQASRILPKTYSSEICQNMVAYRVNVDSEVSSLNKLLGLRRTLAGY